MFDAAPRHDAMMLMRMSAYDTTDVITACHAC